MRVCGHGKLGCTHQLALLVLLFFQGDQHRVPGVDLPLGHMNTGVQLGDYKGDSKSQTRVMAESQLTRSLVAAAR